MSAINVTLGLNAARFRSGAAQAASYAKQFSSSIRTAMLSALGPIAIAMEAFNFLKQTFAEANQLADISQRMGVSSDALQRVAFAARKVGIELDAVGGIIKGLQRGFAGAFTSAAKTTALRDLGFTMEEIQSGGVSAEQAIIRLSEGYDNAANKAEYLAKLQTAFGKAAFDVMGLLALSTDELKSSFREAIIMSEESINAADEMGESWDKMLDGLKIVGMGLLGVFGLILGAVGTFVGSVGTYLSGLSMWIMGQIAEVAENLAKIANKVGATKIGTMLSGAAGVARWQEDISRKGVEKFGSMANISAEMSKASWHSMTGGAFKDKKEKPAAGRRRDLGEVETAEDKKKGKTAVAGVSSMAVVGGGGLVGGGYDPALAIQREMLEVQKQMLKEQVKGNASPTPTITN